MTMLAWRLAAPGGALSLDRIPLPDVLPATVLVRLAAVPLLGYLGDYIGGKLPYRYPAGPFTPGTNGVGTVEAVGAGVYHLKIGQRVVVSPHLVSMENIDEPTQILMGLTAVSPDSSAMLADWANGTLAEAVLVPAQLVTPLDGLEAYPSETLATLGKFAVPLGGLARGRLAAGERVVVNGATGYFGSAAVALALALGAEKVVAAGRSASQLDELVTTFGGRVVAVPLSGIIDQDADTLKAAAGGRGAHLAFDMVGRATEAGSTLAALKSLQRGGRLVLMGSLTVPLPITYGELLMNDWEIIGNFMYRPEVFRRLAALIRGGLLDPSVARVTSFAFKDLPQAMNHAAQARGLACTVLKIAG